MAKRRLSLKQQPHQLDKNEKEKENKHPENNKIPELAAVIKRWLRFVLYSLLQTLKKMPGDQSRCLQNEYVPDLKKGKTDGSDCLEMIYLKTTKSQSLTTGYPGLLWK